MIGAWPYWIFERKRSKALEVKMKAKEQRVRAGGMLHAKTVCIKATLFEDFWCQFLMKFAGSSCITSVQMGVVPFEELQHWVLLETTGASHVPFDGTPALLGDHLKLCTACTKLTAEIGNKELDLVTRRQIQEITGLLNLYLDGGLDLSWRKTSVVVSKAQGHETLMRNTSASGRSSFCKLRHSRTITWAKHNE
jgi:hypothetical protein